MKVRKWLGATMSAALLTGVLAGCSGNQAQPSPSPTATSSSATPAATPEATPSTLASETPLTLSIHLHYGGGGANGNQIFTDDWAVFNRAAELTNVSLAGTAGRTSTNSAEVYNLMLTSSQLPDIIHYGNKGEINKLGDEGGLIPLQDLIEEHAPNITRFWEERPDIRRYLTTADGNIYYVSFVPDGSASTGWFIRQDWLDDLGLEVPATVDDLYDAYTEFRNEDPNDNGLRDEIPYFNRQRWAINLLLSLWDANNSFVLNPADDTIIYGPMNESYKVAMTNIAQWYDEELIDQEFYTRSGDVRLQLLQDNVGGSTQDWFASTSGYNDRVREFVPGINFAPMAPPADVNGKVGWYDYRASVAQTGWAISASNNNPIETIKYFDFWFTDEGRELANFGIEGETYDLVNGTPIFRDSVLNSPDGVLNELKKYGAQIEIGFHQDFEFERQWTNPDLLPIIDEYADHYIDRSLHVPELNFTIAEQERLTILQGQVDTYLNEVGQRWILGAESVEGAYDNFVNQLRALGIEEILEIRNEAYLRYKQN